MDDQKIVLMYAICSLSAPASAVHRQGGVHVEDPAFRSQKRKLLWEIVIAFPIAIALWLAIYFLLPPLSNAADLSVRLLFAFKWSCIAILFCFLGGIEAVAHERLRSLAIDPLAGYETRRMTINLRYLQNTLEQLILFIAGLFGLAVYSSNGRTVHAISATAIVWIASRFAFWIGYHRGSEHRAVGAPGVMQSMLVLLYVCAMFGFEVGGVVGAVVPLALFAVLEGILVRTTRPVISE